MGSNCNELSGPAIEWATAHALIEHEVHGRQARCLSPHGVQHRAAGVFPDPDRVVPQLVDWKARRQPGQKYPVLAASQRAVFREAPYRRESEWGNE
jgi:hypothetical protein